MAVLINGDGYSPVTAQQDADFYAGIFGQRLRVLDIGSKMAASIISPTCVRVADGEAIVQGRRIHNNVGTYDDFEIPVGEQGITKYYIIGYRLFRDTDTKEKAETFVREVASSTATITEDVLRNGATETYISFYRVTKIGFVIDSVTPMYISSQALVNNYPIGSIYMSTSPTDPSELFGGTWQEIQGKFLLGTYGCKGHFCAKGIRCLFKEAHDLERELCAGTGQAKNCPCPAIRPFCRAGRCPSCFHRHKKASWSA